MKIQMNAIMAQSILCVCYRGVVPVTYHKVHKSSREMGFVSLPDRSLTGWVRTGMRLDLLVGGAAGGVDALAGEGMACGG